MADKNQTYPPLRTRVANWIKWRTIWRHHWSAPVWWQVWK